LQPDGLQPGVQPLQTLPDMIRTAHLGQARTVEGRQLQDVVFTFDTAMLQSMIDTLLKSAVPADAGVEVSVAWENLSGVATIDKGSGHLSGLTMDVAATVVVTAEGQTIKAHITVHQTMAATPNSQPIAWPADLPQ
jgi:hypothetical protein